MNSNTHSSLDVSAHAIDLHMKLTNESIADFIVAEFAKNSGILDDSPIALAAYAMGFPIDSQ